jgi:hypothetical protein
MAIAGFAKTDEVDALITKKLENTASKEDVKTAVEAANAETKSQLQQIQDSLKALTTPKTPETPVAEDDASVRVLTDPTKFVNDATKDLRAGNERVQAQVQEMRARQDPLLSGAFAKFGKELTEEAKKFPLSSQGMDNFWSHVVKNFLGDKMVKGEIRDGNMPTLMGTSSVGVRTDGSSSDPDHGLNPEVASYLRGKGVPIDKAAKIHKLMHVDGEPITIENYFGKKAS